MIKPVITLKKVKTFIGHDGIGLSADVYVDGIKTFYIFDGATGGSQIIQFQKKAVGDTKRSA